MASLTDFKKHIKADVKRIEEYKSYLKICKSENMDYYTATKTVMEYLNPGQQLKADDYKEINKLRKWYEELEV